MTGAVSDGVVWPPGRIPWAVWADPPSLEPVLSGGRESAVVSVWANAGELAGGLGYDRLDEVVGALGRDGGSDGLGGLGPPVRFLAAPLEVETSRLARAALWLGSALDQPHRSAPSDAEVAAARAAAAAVGATLGPEGLQSASAYRLHWLRSALEWGGGVVQESGADLRRRCGQDVTHHAFLLGAVGDGAWPSAAERLPFPVAWCVRRAPESPTAQPDPLAAGIVAVGAETAGGLEARVEQLQAAYRAEGHDLVRPPEQQALAAAMPPWSRLSRRLWRRATRSVLAGA